MTAPNHASATYAHAIVTDFTAHLSTSSPIRFILFCALHSVYSNWRGIRVYVVFWIHNFTQLLILEISHICRPSKSYKILWLKKITICKNYFIYCSYLNHQWRIIAVLPITRIMRVLQLHMQSILLFPLRWKRWCTFYALKTCDWSNGLDTWTLGDELYSWRYHTPFSPRQSRFLTSSGFPPGCPICPGILGCFPNVWHFTAGLGAKFISFCWFCSGEDLSLSSPSKCQKVRLAKLVPIFYF